MKRIAVQKLREKQIVSNLTEEMVERIISPRNDFVFKSLFGSVGQEALVKSFLEAILEIKIESVKLGLETILTPEEMDEKTGILDVRVKLEDGTDIDLEIQNAETGFIIQRAHFYAGRMYSKQLLTGVEYGELNKVVVIFITNFVIFPQLENYHTKWLMTEQKYREERFEEMEIHFIEIPKFLESPIDKKRKIDQWLLFLDYSKKEVIKEMMEENEELRKAEEKLEEMRKDEHMKYLAWLREKQILDMNSTRAEGIRKGKEEGLREGKAEGLREGTSEEKIETAKRLLRNKMDIEVIMVATELSREEIEKIKRELEKEE